MRFHSLFFAALLFAMPSAAKEPEFIGDDNKPMSVALGRFPSSADCGPRCADFIVARGEIVGLEYLRLLVAHVRAGSRPLPLILHSPGGDLEVARAMGDIMAKTGMNVVIARARELPCPAAKPCANREVKPYRLVARRAGCASACALAIAGAARRIVPEGAAIGVHMPHFPEDKKDPDPEIEAFAANLALGTMRNYYARYGIKPAVMDLLAATPADDMRYLTRAELVDLGFIDGAPQSLPRPPPAASGANVLRQRP